MTTIIHTTTRNTALQSEHEQAARLHRSLPRQVRELLAQHRRNMLRFKGKGWALPLSTEATCPHCHRQVPAQFDWADDKHNRIILHFQCPDCGDLSEYHDDTIWTDRQEQAYPHSARQTFSGIKIKPNSHRLPRTVETLCPTCGAVVVGRYFLQDQAVCIEKTCPEHGYFRDIINRDANLYFKAAYWSFQEQPGLQNPFQPASSSCPADCGLCGRHQSCSCLANIDLTNRCNLSCPICFANANVTGYVYEPSFAQVTDMLQALRDIRPTPATAIQFSGGEPTLHPQFLDIIAQAAKMGFSNIQIATNGLKMADYEFAARARQAGLHTLYLQFDGTNPEIYLQTRGRDIWDKKLQVVENCRKLDLKICLVPTIIKTVNDDQVGPIFHFAVDNIDVISAISYQPVCFTGRIDPEQRLRQRYTLGDLAHDLAQATGADVQRDFYPLSIVMPLSQFLESITGQPKIKPSCHTDCALGSYFLVSPDKKVYPFPEVLDVEKMFTGMNRLARHLARHPGKLNAWNKWQIYHLFRSVFRTEKAPPQLDVRKFIQTLQGLVDKNKGRGQTGRQNYRTLMAAGMHFQDRYNYDVERVKRCVIPYSTPAGLFPFCTYNSGPTYREIVEKAFAKPVHPS